MTEAQSLRVHRPRRFPMVRAVAALILREMSTTYGASPGGYIWAILEPVAAISVFSIVFAMMTHQPPLGRDFVVFYACGFLAMSSYQALAVNVGAAIRFSRQLLAYPTVTYVDAIVARIVLTFLTNILVGIIVMVGALSLSKESYQIDYIAVFRCLGMIFALGVSVGLVNCFLMSMFPIWQYVWAVANRPMFLISGVLFLIDNMPETFRDILLLNPVAHIVSMAHVGLYNTYDGVFVSETYVYGISLVLAAFGMLLLHRFHRTILNERA